MPCRCSSHHHHLASADQQPWEGALPRLRTGCPEQAPYHLRAQMTYWGEPQVLPSCEKQTLRAQGTAEKLPQSPRLLLHWPRPQSPPLIGHRERRACICGSRHRWKSPFCP